LSVYLIHSILDSQLPSVASLLSSLVSVTSNENLLSFIKVPSVGSQPGPWVRLYQIKLGCGNSTCGWYDETPSFCFKLGMLLWLLGGPSEMPQLPRAPSLRSCMASKDSWLQTSSLWSTQDDPKDSSQLQSYSWLVWIFALILILSYPPSLFAKYIKVFKYLTLNMLESKL
jgi:hypothetical protein